MGGLNMPENDRYWMQYALDLATQAEAEGEVPVGAVLLREGKILGEGWNRPIACCDPTAHAEVVAIRAAGQAAGNYRLPNSTLYVTLEPCTLCVGAIMQARIERVVFGAYDPKAGAAGSMFDLLASPHFMHTVTITPGIMAEPCGEKLRNFFRLRRTAHQQRKMG